MTLFRFHRGSLSDSMNTVVPVSGLYELIAQLSKLYEPGKILVRPYGYDKRTGWNTHIVTIDGNAVGFTDGPIEPSQPDN